MATLRNLAISLHRRASASNVAAACRHISRHPNRALRLITNSPINLAGACAMNDEREVFITR